MKKKTLTTGFGGVYDKGENLVAAQWAMDSNVSTVLIVLISHRSHVLTVRVKPISMVTCIHSSLQNSIIHLPRHYVLPIASSDHHFRVVLTPSLISSLSLLLPSATVS